MDKTSFFLDDKRFWLVSGAIHFFRVPAAYWQDILEKAVQAGLNTVETYVAWNFHEPVQGKFDWSGDKDLGRFIDVAGSLGLKVIVRPGPYICSEWDFGGLPSWLVQTRDITTRDMHPVYLQAVERYLNQVLPIIASRQYTRGGPVIMVQNENEYFFTGRPGGKEHLEWIRDKMLAAGIDVPINSCNHFNEPISGTLETMNGFSNACELVDTLHEKQPDKPAVITEFWPGWFSKWGGPFPDWKTPREVQSLAMGMLARQGMYSYYMFFGGTDFGFFQGPFDTTSYDYGAPVTETRQPGEQYYLTRLANYCSKNLGPIVADMSKIASPKIEGPFEIKSLSSPAGTLHFLRILYKDTRLPVRNAKVFLKNPALPLRLSFHSTDAVIIPENFKLSDHVTIDYADLTPLGLMQNVLVFVGDNSSPFTISINGEIKTGFVPADEILSPLILKFGGKEVWVLNYQGAGRLFETSSGELVCGYDYVSPSGAGFLFAGAPNLSCAARLIVRRTTDGSLKKSRSGPAVRRIKPAKTTGWEHASAFPKDSAWRALKSGGELAGEDILFGYGWYRTRRPVEPGKLNVFFPLASDRVTIYSDGKAAGTWGRADDDTFLPLPVTVTKPGQLLFLADNLGRENFGSPLEESKGIYGPVALDAHKLATKLVSVQVIDKVSDELLNDYRWKSGWHGAAVNALEVVVQIPDEKAPISLIAARPGKAFIVYLHGKIVTWNFRHGHRRHLAFNLGPAGGHSLRFLFPAVTETEKALGNRPFDDAFMLFARTKEIASSDLEIANLAEPSEWSPGGRKTGLPTFYRGRFQWTEGMDAVIRTGRLGKGYIVINGFCIGRYWEIGPYPVYYIPGNILHETNEILVFDEAGRGPDRTTVIEPVEPSLMET
jgi:hypothetical protein